MVDDSVKEVVGLRYNLRLYKMWASEEQTFIQQIGFSNGIA